MSTTTPINGWTVPTTDDTPDIGEIATLANAIDQRVIPVFATTGARNSAITVPVQGMFCYVTSTTELYVYNGTTWVSAVPRRAFILAGQNYTTASFINVNGLSLPVEANCTYIWKMVIAYIAPTAAGFATQMAVPSGSGAGLADFRAALGEYSGGTNPDQTAMSIYTQLGTTEYATSYNYGGGAAQPLTLIEHGCITISSTSGSFQVQGRQVVASGVTSTAGGWIEMWKVS